MMTSTSYSSVTELSGEEISEEQLNRFYTRYKWAQSFCENKDIVEVACGAGQGLGLLESVAKSVTAGDIDPEILQKAKNHYKNRINLSVFSAEKLPAADHSQDIIILFEAIYYLKDVNTFIDECQRVLKKEGKVLICTANKDLYDFNPSPYAHQYYNLFELRGLFEKKGFLVRGFASHPLHKANFRQKILRPIKKLVVSLGMMPQSMKGKGLLKRLVFGKMIQMPNELQDYLFPRIDVEPDSMETPNTTHKVLYCCATKK